MNRLLRLSSRLCVSAGRSALPGVARPAFVAATRFPLQASPVRAFSTESSFAPTSELPEDEGADLEAEQDDVEFSEGQDELADADMEMETESPSEWNLTNSGEETPAAASVAKPVFNRTVYVGGISFRATKDDIWEHFADCGDLEDVSMPQDDSGRHKGIAFLRFADEGSVRTALAKDGSDLKGRWVRVQLRKKPIRSEKPEGCTTLFVGNIAWSASERLLFDIFAECGEVTSVRLMRDDSGRSRGYGWVDFADEESLDRAMESMSGVEIEGREVRLDYGKARSFRSGPRDDAGRSRSRGRERNSRRPRWEEEDNFDF